MATCESCRRSSVLCFEHGTDDSHVTTSVKRFLDIPAESELVSLVLDGPNEFSKVNGSRADVIQYLDLVGSAHS
jgi:hypothetical protein